LIRRVDFKVKCFDSGSITEINIELHHSSADAQASPVRMYSDIEKFRLYRNIPETYEADDPLA
jgi:hypothetical protein